MEWTKELIIDIVFFSFSFDTSSRLVIAAGLDGWLGLAVAIAGAIVFYMYLNDVLGDITNGNSIR